MRSDLFCITVLSVMMYCSDRTRENASSYLMGCSINQPLYSFLGFVIGDLFVDDVMVRIVTS